MSAHRWRMNIHKYRQQIRRAELSPYGRWLRMMLRIGSSLRKRNFE